MQTRPDPRTLFDRIEDHAGHRLTAFTVNDSNDHKIAAVIECSECFEIVTDVTVNTSRVGVDPRSGLS